jgi:hypothetical protein
MGPMTSLSNLRSWPYCLPRFPQLAAEAQAALSQRRGPASESARIWFDCAVIQHFRSLGGLEGFDFEAGLNRLCDAIMARDMSVSTVAASSAASLLDDRFYGGPEHKLRLHAALDRASNVHGESCAMNGWPSSWSHRRWRGSGQPKRWRTRHSGGRSGIG